MSETQVVQVQSAMFSWTNAAQYIALAAGALTYFGVIVPEDVQKQVLAGIIAVVTIFTWVRRMFFSRTITPAAAAKLP